MAAAGSQEQQGYLQSPPEGVGWATIYIYIRKFDNDKRSRKDLELAELGLRKLSDELGRICIILEDLFNKY